MTLPLPEPGEHDMDSTTKKGFQLLELLAQSDEPRAVSDVARETGLTRSNVQRTLATLCELGYAEQDPASSRYYPSLRLWEMGIPVLSRNEVVRAARARLLALYNETGETTLLCLRQGDEIVYVNKLESQTPIRMSCAIGTRLPLHATATGRVIAAYLPDADRARICDAAPTQGKTALAGELVAIRARGFAVSIGAYRRGVNSIAVPVHASADGVEASIALTGPEERLSPEWMQSQLHRLMDAAACISGSLGYRGGA